jgi:hypothetical protein
MKQKISDEELEHALSLFRDSVREFHPAAERKPARSFSGSRLAFAVFAIVMFFLAVVPVYRQRQAEIAASAKQDDALLRGVEDDVAFSVPQPMQRLELLMASDTERSK